MSWDFSTDPGFAEKLDWMRDFVREEVWPLEVVDTDRAGIARLMKPLQEEVKARGLWACHLPPELGGQGYGQVKLALMHEILGTSNYAPPVFGNQAPDSGNSEILSLYGTAEQKKRWMEPLLAGEIRSAFSMTEPAPGAGADPTMLRTTAVLDGDEWVINGHKWFTTGADRAAFTTVFAKTEPSEDNRYRQFSAIIVPTDTPGYDIARVVPTMGHTGGHHCEVYYHDVRVPAANVLGDRGEGFVIAQRRLGPGRIFHCMRWLGQAQRAFELMCERATTRFAHGSLLAEKGEIQRYVAESAAEIQAARLMTLDAAQVIDDGGEARVEISLIKFWGARMLHNVIDRAIQVHGALGVTADTPLEKMYREARYARIYDGPDEVHRMVVARRLLKDYKSGAPWA